MYLNSQWSVLAYLDVCAIRNDVKSFQSIKPLYEADQTDKEAVAYLVAKGFILSQNQLSEVRLTADGQTLCLDLFHNEHTAFRQLRQEFEEAAIAPQ